MKYCPDCPDVIQNVKLVSRTDGLWMGQCMNCFRMGPNADTRKGAEDLWDEMVTLEEMPNRKRSKKFHLVNDVPPEKVEVLVQVEGGRYLTAYRDGNSWYSNYMGDEIKTTIIRWKKLPKR